MTQPQSAPASHGVVFAKTRGGVALPVIDFTNPNFVVSADPAALRQAFVNQERKRRRIPEFIMRMMLPRRRRNPCWCGRCFDRAPIFWTA
jgi:hypothetical protein